MQKEIVVIIGGPGTGKTTIIDGLLSMGYCCYPEISREVTMEAKKQGKIHCVNRLGAFNKKIPWNLLIGPGAMGCEAAKT